MTKTKTTFTIENITGGDRAVFRLVDGQLSDRAVRHARGIGLGGPVFGGPAADEASASWDALEEAEVAS